MSGRSREAIGPVLKVVFLCIVGLGRYTRQPNDSTSLASNVTCKICETHNTCVIDRPKSSGLVENRRVGSYVIASRRVVGSCLITGKLIVRTSVYIRINN